jgi:hypothetical protein
MLVTDIGHFFPSTSPDDSPVSLPHARNLDGDRGLDA